LAQAPAPTSEVDVLVVGAGPGGSAAAYYLARHGVDVALVDKASFPREKVCGDGLTPRVVKALLDMGVDTEDPGFVRVDGLRVYGPNCVLDLEWPNLATWPDYGLVRTRLDFDQLLANRAVKAGAALWEKTEAVAPITDGDWVVGANVREAGDGQRNAEPPLRSVKARFVIAADGASSRFAGHVGVRRDPTRPLGIAARRYYRLRRPQQPWLEAWMDLWERDDILPGYGWLFPIGEEGLANVGAGLLNTFKGFKDVSAQHVFDVFVRSLPAEWGANEDTAAGRLLSGPLPMGMNRRPLAVPGMLVVGDAGGAVNPFNGEGISYAMETGKLAAELVYESLVKHRPGLAHVYPTILRERYGRYFYIGRKFVKAIGKPEVMRTLTKYGLPREWLMRFALRFLANLTDGRRGDAQDKLMYALERLAPAS
jgi:geranylgeranyl reductase family protein